MFKIRCLFQLFLILIVLCSCFSVDSVFGEDPKVFYVSPSGNDDNNGLTPQTAKKSIQKIVDNAPIRCDTTIYLANGVYRERITIAKMKFVQLIGKNPETTIIHGMNQPGCIYVTGSSKVLVQGLTLTGSKNECRDPIGAITTVSSMLTVNNCIVKENYSNKGSGIVCINDGLDDESTKKNTFCIKNSIISNNTALTEGGGIYIYRTNTIIENCTISNNKLRYSSDGGGISIDNYVQNNEVLINNSVISENNVAEGSIKSGGSGGGIFITGYVTIKNSRIEKNEAEYGGGLYNLGILTLKNVKIKNNYAVYGGGILNSYRIRGWKTCVEDNYSEKGDDNIANWNPDWDSVIIIN